MAKLWWWRPPRRRGTLLFEVSIFMDLPIRYDWKIGWLGGGLKDVSCFLCLFFLQILVSWYPNKKWHCRDPKYWKKIVVEVRDSKHSMKLARSFFQKMEPTLSSEINRKPFDRTSLVGDSAKWAWVPSYLDRGSCSMHIGTFLFCVGNELEMTRPS